MFKYVEEDTLAALLEIIKSKNVKIDYQYKMNWYCLPRSKALDFQIT